jgi:non-specific serine/threonine protein kinase
MPHRSFAELLRSHRLRIGLTQEAVAERASLSVHAIQKLEHGTTHPYRDTTNRLVQALELSADDEAEFRQVGQPVARHRSHGRPAHEADIPIGHSAPPDLPVPLTSFVGRQHDLAEICSILRKDRLLTLTGVGGCGKTRLAFEAARTLSSHFEDGTWLVELAPLRDETQVAQAIASTFGVREVATQPLLRTLVTALKPRRVLLVLDNCEHLLDACARLVDALLSGCQRLQVLATSREALGLTGEVSWRVPSLTAPPSQPVPTPAAAEAYAASKLFVERAHAANSTFTVTPRNVASIVRICQRLDGIPLALELAAVLVRGMSVDELGARLDQRFTLLTGGSRAALPRQQTLRATIEWSYQLLSPAQRELFSRLSVFPDGWNLAAAEAVGAGDGIEPAQVLGLLIQLVDKSLVVAEEGTDGAERYAMLETLRQFGREQLVAGESAMRTHQQHAEYYLGLAERAEADGSEPEAATWTERLALEQSNFGAALDWLMAQGNVDSAMRLSSVLWHLWQVRGNLREGRQRLTKLLNMPCASHPSLARARVLEGAGVLAMYQADANSARQLFKECLWLYRQYGDDHRRAWVLIDMAWLASDLFYNGAGRRFVAEALDLCERHGDRYGTARALNVQGLLEWQRGDYAACFPLHRQSLAISRELNDGWGIAWALHRLCVAQLTEVSRGRMPVQPVLPMIEEEVTLWLRLGERRHYAFSLCNRGVAAAFDGRPADARAALAQALAIFDELDDQHGTMYAFAEHWYVCVAEGRPELGLQVFAAVVAFNSKRSTLRKVRPAVWRDTQQFVEEQVRSSLGAAAVAECWEEGGALSLEEAVARVEGSFT